MPVKIDFARHATANGPVERTVLSEFLLPRIAAGDSTAVEACLARYGGLVWSIVKRMTRSDVEAEDLVQEIFIELWQVAKRFDPAKASESTFVTMLARRRLIDRLRKNRNNLDRIPFDSENAENFAVRDHNRLELADEAAKAAACFEKLTEHAQSVLRLNIHHGRSQSEIATQLNLPLGSVKSFARRGLLQLRDCMQRPFVNQVAGAAT